MPDENAAPATTGESGYDVGKLEGVEKLPSCYSV